MTEIDQLIDTLHAMHAVSLGFRRDLAPMMKAKTIKDHTPLLKMGKKANKAWQIIRGYIIAVEGDARESSAVKKVYGPGHIVTDLGSFFERTNSKFTFYAVGELKVLELKKKDFIKLNKYPETEKLVQHIMLLENTTAMQRADLLTIQSATTRVRAFLETYPTAGLPNPYAASFLGISEESYVEEKCQLIAQGTALATPNLVPDNDPTETSYRVRSYLKANFASRSIGTVNEVAEQLHTTAKTINRAMKKTFGFTVHQYLSKFRMEHAQKLLMENMLIKNVAEAVGYADQATFSKSYKKYYGYSPKDTPDH